MLFRSHKHKQRGKASTQQITTTFAGVLTDSSGVGLGSVTFNVEKLALREVGSDLVQPCSLDKRLVDARVPKVLILHQRLVEMDSARLDLMELFDFGLFIKATHVC